MFCLSIEMEFENSLGICFVWAWKSNLKKACAFVLSEQRNPILKKAWTYVLSEWVLEWV